MRSKATAIAFIALLWAGSAFASNLDDARRAIAQQQFDLAETQLVKVARDGDGEERQEALFMLAGLKKSVSEAQIIYQEVIDIGHGTRWATRSSVELAKIEYALGRYDHAYNILEADESCGGRFPEACYFQGLAAAQMNQYEPASRALQQVKRGRYESWANIALAELAMSQNRLEEACTQYRTMARAAISPTAMYRYGECLEKLGDESEAAAVFQELLEKFPGTPEAVLATEKLQVLTKNRGGAKQGRPAVANAAPAEGIPTSGFTLQFGAFHDRANAIRVAGQLKRTIPGVRIDSDLVNYKEVHRVRLGYFRTREEAQEKANEVSAIVNEPVSIMSLH